MRFSPRGFGFSIVALLNAGACATVAAAEPFYMGGDVSLLPYIESRGGSFRDAGQTMPADQILVDHGANLFRLRLFVNPNPNYSATQGAIQDLNYTISLAQRLKAGGASFLLDLHYSDTWADPGKQYKPAAWTGLSFSQLNTTVHDYTRDTLLSLKNAGVMPDMVQVGNEVTNGMLWPSGQVTYSGTQQQQNQSWMNFGSLLNSAIRGVRDVDAMFDQHTLIAIHCDGGNVNGRAQYYFNQINNIAGVSDYDIEGLSFYPASNGSTSFNNLQTNLAYLDSHFDRKVMVLETNNPWKGTPNGSQWAFTPAGQQQFFTDVRDAVRNLPNGHGAGAIWWYPESIQVPNTSIYRGGANALFDDSGGDALPAVDALSLPAPTWNLDADGVWSAAGNWSGGTLPDGATQTARFGSAISLPRTITLDSARTVGTISFVSASRYTIAGPETLTLDNGPDVARIDVLRGSHTIDAALLLVSDTQINVAFNNTLTITGGMTSAGRAITKTGSGSVQLPAVQAAKLDIELGRATLSPAGTSVVQSLSIATDATLDLTSSSMIIDYTDPLGTLVDDTRLMLKNNELISSSADGTHRIGYLDNSTRGLATFSGKPVDATCILIDFTYAGDANLDGQVDVTDLGALATNWQTPGVWSDGDFNYDGVVDVTDLGMLATNWQAGVGLDEALASVGLSGAGVPEPSALAAMLGLLIGSITTRRRASQF